MHYRATMAVFGCFVSGERFCCRDLAHISRPVSEKYNNKGDYIKHMELKIVNCFPVKMTTANNALYSILS